MGEGVQLLFDESLVLFFWRACHMHFDASLSSAGTRLLSFLDDDHQLYPEYRTLPQSCGEADLKEKIITGFGTEAKKWMRSVTYPPRNPCAPQTALSKVRQIPFPWPTKEISVVEDVDFGSLAKNYGPPLIICFYRDVCGNPVTRISEFCDVPLGEAVRALNAQHEHTQYTNLLVKFDSCREEDVATFLVGLLPKLLLFRCRINFTMPEWERCVLLMADYKFANEVVEIMAEFTNKCLRLFTFVQMDARLSVLVAKCPFLSHISLCRISVIEHPVFNGVESFEFNGCGMAHTEQDLQVAKVSTAK
uniref:Tudor domain-containing protein n=1 Tax=Angiostrongylus cantonensis TaxID=6313 RepID=A0A0K0DDQ5_ANGCA